MSTYQRKRRRKRSLNSTLMELWVRSFGWLKAAVIWLWVASQRSPLTHGNLKYRPRHNYLAGPPYVLPEAYTRKLHLPILFRSVAHMQISLKSIDHNVQILWGSIYVSILSIIFGCWNALARCPLGLQWFFLVTLVLWTIGMGYAISPKARKLACIMSFIRYDISPPVSWTQFFRLTMANFICSSLQEWLVRLWTVSIERNY